MCSPRQSHVSDPPRPDTKDVITRAGELDIQVKMITVDHVAIAKETCRVICTGTQMLTTKYIPTNEADTLGARFGELVESCDGFADAHPEHKIQIVQATRRLHREARPGGGLDRGARWKARPGALDRGALLGGLDRGALSGSPSGGSTRCVRLQSKGCCRLHCSRQLVFSKEAGNGQVSNEIRRTVLHRCVPSFEFCLWTSHLLSALRGWCGIGEVVSFSAFGVGLMRPCRSLLLVRDW